MVPDHKSQGFGSEIVFVIGAPRSGTTILKKVLRLHEDIISIGVESGYICCAIDKFGHLIGSRSAEVLDFISNHHFSFNKDITNIYSSRFPDDEHLTLGELLLRLYRLEAGDQKAKRILLQYPGLGLLRHDDLLALFPGAKFLVVQRDARGNVSSQLKAFRGKGLLRCCRLWNQCVRSKEILKSKNSANVFEVRYEDLLEGNSSLSSELQKFIGLKTSLELREFEVRSTEVDANHLAVSKVFTRFESRMKSKWKDNLSVGEIWFIEWWCGNYMRSNGYEFFRPTMPYAKRLIFATRIFISAVLFKLAWIWARKICRGRL